MPDKPALEFVDTNILVYAHDRSAGDKHTRAVEIVAELWRSRRGCISVQVLQELYVVGLKRIPLAQSAVLRTILADLCLWRVHSPSGQDVLEVITLSERYQISFWDAMIVHSSITLGCATLWSEDLNSGQKIASVQVINPFASPAALIPNQNV